MNYHSKPNTFPDEDQLQYQLKIRNCISNAFYSYKKKVLRKIAEETNGNDNRPVIDQLMEFLLELHEIGNHLHQNPFVHNMYNKVLITKVLDSYSEELKNAVERLSDLSPKELDEEDKLKIEMNTLEKIKDNLDIKSNAGT